MRLVATLVGATLQFAHLPNVFDIGL